MKLFCKHEWKLIKDTVRLYNGGISKEGMYECCKCGKLRWFDIFNMKPNKYKFKCYSKGEISDGYHTFDELYYHRMVLFSVIVNQNKSNAWKSWKHHDGTMYDDYFIVGMQTKEGQYSYHYHKDYWNMFDIAELEFAPEWDGHKPSDITRLLDLL